MTEISSRSREAPETRARRQNVELCFSPKANQIEITADHDHLQQLFLNLAMNALDANSADGGKLRVSLRTLVMLGLDDDIDRTFHED